MHPLAIAATVPEKNAFQQPFRCPKVILCAPQKQITPALVSSKPKRGDASPDSTIQRWCRRQRVKPAAYLLHTKPSTSFLKKIENSEALPPPEPYRFLQGPLNPIWCQSSTALLVLALPAAVLPMRPLSWRCQYPRTSCIVFPRSADADNLLRPTWEPVLSLSDVELQLRLPSGNLT
jgi:hypothetical protein